MDPIWIRSESFEDLTAFSPVENSMGPGTAVGEGPDAWRLSWVPKSTAPGPAPDTLLPELEGRSQNGDLWNRRRMSEQPKLKEMWRRVRNRNYHEEPGDPRNAIERLLLSAIAVGAAISVLMQISGNVVVLLAVTLFLLIFGYVAWSLMIRLRRDQRR